MIVGWFPDSGLGQLATQWFADPHNKYNLSPSTLRSSMFWHIQKLYTTGPPTLATVCRFTENFHFFEKNLCLGWIVTWMFPISPPWIFVVVDMLFWILSSNYCSYGILNPPWDDALALTRIIFGDWGWSKWLSLNKSAIYLSIVLSLYCRSKNFYHISHLVDAWKNLVHMTDCLCHLFDQPTFPSHGSQLKAYHHHPILLQNSCHPQKVLPITIDQLSAVLQFQKTLMCATSRSQTLSPFSLAPRIVASIQQHRRGHKLQKRSVLIHQIISCRRNTVIVLQHTR